MLEKQQMWRKSVKWLEVRESSHREPAMHLASVDGKDVACHDSRQTLALYVT